MPKNFYLNAFFKVIEIGTFMDDEKRKHLSKIIKVKSVKKGEAILKEGMPCRHLFFLCKGLFRSFYTSEEGKEITSAFSFENEFFTNIKGFINGINSNETIVAQENSYICVIDRTDYYNLLKNNSSLAFYSHEVINKHRVELEDRIRFLQNGIAKDKLKFFEEYYPGLSERIPKKYIATFLGMRYETMHRASKSKIEEARQKKSKLV